MLQHPRVLGGQQAWLLLDTVGRVAPLGHQRGAAGIGRGDGDDGVIDDADLRADQPAR